MRGKHHTQSTTTRTYAEGNKKQGFIGARREESGVCLYNFNDAVLLIERIFEIYYTSKEEKWCPLRVPVSK